MRLKLREFLAVHGRIIATSVLLNKNMTRCNERYSVRCLSCRDALTGLYSYEYFNRKIEQYDVKEQLPLSVMICDVNGLNLISDTLGASKAEALLVNAAKFISNCVRKGDIVARTGSDRFFILLPQTNSKTAQFITERIQRACKDKEAAGGELPVLNISMGSATKESETEDIRSILIAAEKELHIRKLHEQSSFYSSLLKSIKKALYEKSHETEEHGERLVWQSKLLGRALGLSERQLDSLEVLATLHDIGKVGIEESILTKPGPLDGDEWNEIKKHPETGYRIAKAVPQLTAIAEDILYHHERWDGKGYPAGLSGKRIPLFSRIIAVVDTFDALTSKRCYREAVGADEALEEIERNAGTQFDPEIARVFINMKRAPEYFHEKNSSFLWLL